MSRKILITGVAGFVGMHLAKKFSEQKDTEIVGIDNFNGVNGYILPYLRINHLGERENIKIFNFDLNQDISTLPKYALEGINIVIHLAALPGVKGGELDLHSYYKQNVSMFGNVLKLVNKVSPEKFLFASSSSVYGQKLGINEVIEDQANGSNLKSFYASTKWANEVVAEQFCRLTGITTVPMRFFTVFGSFGRPDMAYWKFAKLLLENKSIEFWGENGGSRNFTYIEDLVDIIDKLSGLIFSGYNPLNLAAGESFQTKEMCDILASALKVTNYAYNFIERPNFDLEKINANTSKLRSLIGDIKQTSFPLAVTEFADWYLSFKSKNPENPDW